MVVLGRDFLVDVDGGVERAGQRHVLDDGDVVLARDLPDLEGEIVDALGDADRRLHAALVGQRHRIVGRVGDDHAGLGNGGHHGWFAVTPTIASAPTPSADGCRGSP